MKLYHSLVPLLVIAQDDDPLADWEIRDLSLQCGFDTPTELSFEVYPGDIDIDTSTFHARDCSYGDLTEVITEAVTENLPADQQDKGRTKYTVKYNPNTCMSTVADPANLGTYASNVTFNFDFGYEHQSVFMHMRTYRIPAICSFQSQYNLKFDFGKIEQGIVETNGTDLQPVNGGIVFDFNVYKDSALTEPVYNTNSGLKTGQMVYFTIVPEFNFPSGLQYAPPVCRFLQETCDEDDNCNVHQEFTLFSHEVDECQQPPNSPLQFDINYIRSTDEWRSQFRLFLFGEDIDQSTFTLRCEVDVCVDTCSSDVVVENQQCGNIAQACLSDASYLEYNDQCLQCGVGKQPNNSHDGCDDCAANTYNDNTASISPCQDCVAGYISEAGASVCYQLECALGQQQNSAGDSCEDCPENFYNDNNASVSPCQPCGTGYFSEAGASVCCPEGESWNSDTGSCESNGLLRNKVFLAPILGNSVFIYDWDAENEKLNFESRFVDENLAYPNSYRGVPVYHQTESKVYWYTGDKTMSIPSWDYPSGNFAGMSATKYYTGSYNTAVYTDEYGIIALTSNANYDDHKGKAEHLVPLPGQAKKNLHGSAFMDLIRPGIAYKNGKVFVYLNNNQFIVMDLAPATPTWVKMESWWGNTGTQFQRSWGDARDAHLLSYGDKWLAIGKDDAKTIILKLSPNDTNFVYAKISNTHNCESNKCLAFIQGNTLYYLEHGKSSSKKYRINEDDSVTLDGSWDTSNVKADMGGPDYNERVMGSHLIYA